MELVPAPGEAYNSSSACPKVDLAEIFEILLEKIHSSVNKNKLDVSRHE